MPYDPSKYPTSSPEEYAKNLLKRYKGDKIKARSDIWVLAPLTDGNEREWFLETGRLINNAWVIKFFKWTVYVV